MLPLLTWLIQGGLGPALVALPVNWAAKDLAKAASGWFRRLRRSDGLSRIVRAAARDLDLSNAESTAVRRLLENQSTWVEVGRGTVEDLAVMIKSCLPDRPDNSALAAGRAIAGGLLEFAARDLEPEWFQQVLFARLDRMQADQASALDQALLSVHADLAALLAYQDVADADRFARVVGQLARILDRLPPGPADRGEVAVYLATLIRWLNTDPWPQDTRFAGPALTPSAIERKLSIVIGRGHGQDLDADGLARRCARLVVLGGPGSGKTWLARRTARLCAEAALNALAAGALPDEVELPLYTTCARLFAAPPSDGIRRAIVASALGQLPDLGGSRVLDALRVLFEERNAPTLLVADSLDEARGADDRIRQADTLSQAWRIVLTSRPTSWNGQLDVGGDDSSRLAGYLQPLRYPADVEPFIAAWFSGRPQWAAGLTAQLRSRPAERQAATVPLILAFYCIVGADQPLPARRADLYAKVIRRMFTGRWRGSSHRDPDPGACLETLRDWAWSAAASDPVSGVGVWADEFDTPRVRQSPDDRDALDHVAVPLGSPDADTGMTRRRFVHRSIQEHLVAEQVALRMPAEEAVKELLNHLWYDPDWEYTAPAALAMHPQRDQVVKELIWRVTGCELPADLAAIDGCWEIRRFLARVAQESGEGDWSPKAAEMVSRARLELGTSRLQDLHLVRAGDWPTSNGLILESLLGLLGHETDATTARGLADAVAGLAVTAEDRARTGDVLLGLLGHETDATTARGLADRVVGLAVTAEDRARAREALLGLLGHETDPGPAEELADAIARLDPTAEDQARAREALLGLLGHETNAWPAQQLADAIARLDPTAEDQARAREALLGLLGHETNAWPAQQLADAIARLDPTAEDQARAREALLGLLAHETDPETAEELADAIARLDPTAEGRARAALPDMLAHKSAASTAQRQADRVAELGGTAADRTRTREALLGLLAHETDPGTAEELADAIARLDPTAEERARAREALLGRFAHETNPVTAGVLTNAVAELAVTAEDRTRTREALLGLLARGGGSAAWTAWELVDAFARLDPTAEERARAREALLGLLADVITGWTGWGVVDRVARLCPGHYAERERTREVLLGLLVGAVTRLDPTAEDRARAREALLGLLAHETDPGTAEELADAIARLDPTAEDRARAREALLGLLGHETDPETARGLADAVAGLSPTVADLGGSDAWSAPPTSALLAAARQNSGLPSWLAALPLLSRSARSKAESDSSLRMPNNG